MTMYRQAFDEMLKMLQKDRDSPIDIGHLRTKIIPYLKVHSYALTDEDKRSLTAGIMKAYALSREDLDEELVRPSIKQQKEVDDFMELVPGSGLLRDYITYTKSSEPSTVFHFFSFLTVLGAALKRSIWVEQGVLRPIYPNMVTILVGPSGKAKKTTAEDIALELGLLSGRVEMVGGEKATGEAVLDDLAERKNAVGLVYAPELSVLFGRQKYNEGLVQLFTRLWDCPDLLPIKTIKRGAKDLRNVGVSMLGGSNEVWLVGAIPDDAFSGGFMARVLQIYQRSSPRDFPWPDPPNEQLKRYLIQELAQTERCHGAVAIDARVKKSFSKHYSAYKNASPKDERLVPFFARLPQHLLRVAMVLSVAEERAPVIEIRQRHIDQAHRILGWVTDKLPRIYSFLGATDMGEDGRRIQNLILSHGGRISREILIRKMSNRLTVKALDERLMTLQQGGLIREFHSSFLASGPNRGRVVYELSLPEEEE